MTHSPANIFAWVSAGPGSRLGFVYICLIRPGRNNPDVYQLLNVFSSVGERCGFRFLVWKLNVVS